MNKNGKITSNTDQTIKACEEFYGNLYHQESSDEEIAQEFQTDLPQISQNNKLICDENFSETELKKTVDSLKNNITPGLDGLPTEFYKKFWYLIRTTFTELINTNFENGNDLSKSQREGMIKLICKNKKKKNH